MTSLGSLVTINPPGSLPDGPTSVIALADIDAFSGTVAPREVREREEAGSARRVARKGDVLFARISPSMENGKIAVVPQLNTPGALVSGELLVLRPKEGVDSQFIWAFLRQRYLLRQLADRTTGSSGYQRIDPRILEEIEVRREQDRTWPRDREVLRCLDRAVVLRSRTLERIRQLVGTTAMAVASQATGEEQLHDLADLRSGTAEAAQASGELPVLRIPNLRDGSIDPGRLRYVPDRRGTAPKLQRGDLLVIRVSGSAARIGYAAVYEGNPPRATVASHLVRIRVRQISSDLLWAWLQTEGARTFCLAGAMTPTRRYSLTLQTLGRLPVPVLPSYLEDSLAQFAGVVRRMLTHANHQLTMLEAAVQAHLEQVFGGVSPSPREVFFDSGVLTALSKPDPVPAIPTSLLPVFGVASEGQQDRWRRAVSRGRGFRLAELMDSEHERASLQHTLAVLEQLGVLVKEREGVVDNWRLPDSEEEGEG